MPPPATDAAGVVQAAGFPAVSGTNRSSMAVVCHWAPSSRWCTAGQWTSPRRWSVARHISRSTGAIFSGMKRLTSKEILAKLGDGQQWRAPGGRNWRKQIFPLQISSGSVEGRSLSTRGHIKRAWQDGGYTSAADSSISTARNTRHYADIDKIVGGIYTHDVIIHQQHFEDPNDSEVHTQNVENMWMRAKKMFPQAVEHLNIYTKCFQMTTSKNVPLSNLLSSSSVFNETQTTSANRLYNVSNEVVRSLFWLVFHSFTLSHTKLPSTVISGSVWTLSCRFTGSHSCQVKYVILAPHYRDSNNKNI